MPFYVKNEATKMLVPGTLWNSTISK
jgi:hypothetical protein